jgi:3-oxoacyl-(acyl-carrier-protein) synthase
VTDKAVWITGYGAYTAAGPTSAFLADAILSGRSAVRALPEFGGAPCAPIDDFSDCPRGRHLDRSASLFISAAEEAWSSAGLNSTSFEPERIAVFEGSSLGPLAAIIRMHEDDLAKGPKARARPHDILRLMPGAGSSSFAQAHGVHGPVMQITAGSISSACAIGEAYQRIASGAVDVAVAGGSECPLEASIVARFVASGLLFPAAGTSPCRPFDRTRQSIALGEGAGALVLESEAHALSRGAVPRAFLTGYGFASETWSLIAPDPSGVGVLQAIRQAIGNNGGDPGWIKAHGTGTRAGDAAEYLGLAAVFENNLPSIPMTSIKPLIGHCLGASGAIEAVATILAIESGIIPATLGTTEVDPAFPLCRMVLERQYCARNSTLLLSQSFGGRCCVLHMRAPSSEQRPGSVCVSAA